MGSIYICTLTHTRTSTYTANIARSTYERTYTRSHMHKKYSCKTLGIQIVQRVHIHFTMSHRCCRPLKFYYFYFSFFSFPFRENEQQPPPPPPSSANVWMERMNEWISTNTRKVACLMLARNDSLKNLKFELEKARDSKYIHQQIHTHKHVWRATLSLSLAERECVWKIISV